MYDIFDIKIYHFSYIQHSTKHFTFTGYYCDQANAPVTTYTPYTCPAGYYCPNGTKWSTQYGCPLGTYSPNIQLESVDECIQCEPGRYCSVIGGDITTGINHTLYLKECVIFSILFDFVYLFQLKGPCDAGYWCITGAAIPTPTDGVTGKLCPQGHYCPQGAANPVQCPIGTMSNSTGLQSSSDCPSCTGGFYCADLGLTEPSGSCSAGYYCASGASIPVPNDGGITGGPCTIGHYCPEGTATPISCAPGTYMLQEQAASCQPCPDGYYCTTGLTPQLCPPGYYCPESTGFVWESCPEGTYSNQMGLSNETQCTPCDPGYYCLEKNATTPSGICDAGYYCLSGSNTATPDFGYTGSAGPCPPGHYCQTQTSVPQKCPVGRYSDQTHLVASAECELCDYGTYCGEEGLTHPSGLCWAGFYCLRGARAPNNPTEDSTGGPCPLGHYCLNGTSYPLGCPKGTYNPLTGMDSCTECPGGYFCPENSTHYAGNECPAGHYCPLGTREPYEFPCELGYYNNYTGKSSADDCIPCDPSMYCGTAGLTYPTGLCDAGWYCTRGAWSQRPVDFGNSTGDGCFCANNQTGAMCPPGHFCPQGSSQPLSCTPGMLKRLPTNSIYSSNFQI